MSDRNALVKALAPHARRPIRAFLADKAIEGTPAESAFWEAVYAGTKLTEHAEAVRLAFKLEHSAERVERVLEGWKP